MIDSKKLITIFLILSAISSSLAFIFSDSITGRALTPDGAKVALPPDVPPAVPANAFVEPLPETAALPSRLRAPFDDPLPSLKPTANMTEALTQGIVRELAKNNADGPLPTETGYKINMPGEANVLQSMIAGLKIDKNKLLPKFGEKIQDGDLKIIANADSKDKAGYMDSVNQILTATVAGADFQNLYGQEPNAEVFSAARSTLEKAVHDLRSVAVPDSAVNFQKSLLTFLVDQKKTLDAVSDYEADPMKTLLVANEISKKIGGVTKSDLENYAREFGKSFPQSVSATKNKTAFLAAISELFKIKTAYAVAPVFVPTSDYITELSTAGHLTQNLHEWLTKFVISVLKQIIIKRMQAQIVRWVQGGGKPNFITNWKSFVQQSFNAAAGKAIDEVIPGLCRNIGPLVKLHLQQAFFPEPNYGGCTLDQVVQNVESFYRNFENGGWIAYAAASQGSGNFYDSLFFGSQVVSNKANQQQQASQNEGIASRGFISIKECPSGTERIGKTSLCKGKSTQDENGNFQPQKVSNAIDVTPGGAVADTLFKGSISAPVDTITNATEWGDIVAIFAGALINAVTQRGLGLLGAAF